MVVTQFSYVSKVGEAVRSELRRWGEKLWRERERAIIKKAP